MSSSLNNFIIEYNKRTQLIDNNFLELILSYRSNRNEFIIGRDILFAYRIIDNLCISNIKNIIRKFGLIKNIDYIEDGKLIKLKYDSFIYYLLRHKYINIYSKYLIELDIIIDHYIKSNYNYI